VQRAARGARRKPEQAVRRLVLASDNHASCASSPRCWRRSVSRCCRSAARCRAGRGALLDLRRERAGQGQARGGVRPGCQHSPTTPACAAPRSTGRRRALGALRRRGRRRHSQQRGPGARRCSPSPTAAATTPACWRPCEARRPGAAHRRCSLAGRSDRDAAGKSRPSATTRTSGCRAKAARRRARSRGEEPHQPSRAGDARDGAPARRRLGLA